MTRANTRSIVPIVCLVVGVAWAVVGGVEYSWWIDGRPASGFFPSLVGILLAAVALIGLASEPRGEPPKFLVSHVYPAAAAIVAVSAAMLIGFFPALAVYVLLWMRLFERYSWRFSLLTTVFSIGGVFSIFRVWLRIPFPAGYLYRLVVG